MKLDEAMYEIREKMQATERLFTSVMQEKERLEMVVHEGVKLITRKRAMNDL